MKLQTSEPRKLRKVIPAADRFWPKVEKTPTCWIWNGYAPTGYGRIWIAELGRMIMTHRWSYEQVKGAIPEGLVLDHLCRNTLCVNPDHLEAVTSKVNILRGISNSAIHARQTHCKRGHELTGDNLYVWRNKRYCRTCDRNRRRGNKHAANRPLAPGQKERICDLCSYPIRGSLINFQQHREACEKVSREATSE